MLTIKTAGRKKGKGYCTSGQHSPSADVQSSTAAAAARRQIKEQYWQWGQKHAAGYSPSDPRENSVLLGGALISTKQAQGGQHGGAAEAAGAMPRCREPAAHRPPNRFCEMGCTDSVNQQLASSAPASSPCGGAAAVARRAVTCLQVQGGKRVASRAAWHAPCLTQAALCMRGLSSMRTNQPAPAGAGSRSKPPAASRPAPRPAGCCARLRRGSSGQGASRAGGWVRR